MAPVPFVCCILLSLGAVALAQRGSKETNGKMQLIHTHACVFHAHMYVNVCSPVYRTSH